MTNQEQRAAERANDLATQKMSAPMDDEDYFSRLASNATQVSKAEDERLHEKDATYTTEDCVKVYYDGRADGAEWLRYMCSLDGISVQGLSPNDLEADMHWVVRQRQRCRVCSPDLPGHYGEPGKTDCQNKMHGIFSAGFLCGVMTVLAEEAVRR
jgi:hypothetical protein